MNCQLDVNTLLLKKTESNCHHSRYQSMINRKYLNYPSNKDIEESNSSIED